ncbi:MAG: hypothetical protein ACREHC_02645 [Candidatus Levyibacteriota bacterium]
MVAATIYTTKKDTYSFDELSSQKGELLPDREELCVMSYGSCAQVTCAPVQHYESVQSVQCQTSYQSSYNCQTSYQSSYCRY